MISLFIDTSSFNLLVYLLKDDKVINFCKLEKIKSHSTLVLPEIKRRLNEANIKINDIDNIYVVNGPGSFTGLRIGVTIAKIIGYTLNKRVIPISSLDLLATTAFDTDYIIPVIDARRGYVYAGVYDKNLNNILKDQYISLNDLFSKLDDDRTYTFVSYDDMLNIENLIKPNEDISKLINKHQNDSQINIHNVNPNYLKRTEAEEKLKNDKIC